jgi:hypothetical protein
MEKKQRMKVKIILTLALFLNTCFISSPWTSVTGQAPNPVANKRMAGYHFSVVCTGESQPSSAVLTYPVKQADYQNYNFLVKLMPCLSLNGKLVYPSQFQNVRVNDFPGGVEASFTWEDTKIVTRITPLLVGRGSKTWNGAALFEVSTSPAREVLVLLGKGSSLNLYWEFATSFMVKDSTIDIGDFSRINKEMIGFRSGKDDLNVLVKSSAPLVTGNLAGNSRQAYVRFPGGSGYVLTAFSDHATDLTALGKLNFETEKNKVTRYYQELNRMALETPEPVMNQAFASALYNLEYSWFEPFGWGECLHHWLALWHMQVGAAADLIGQEDRSRSCILEHARHLLRDGSVPQFMPNRATKKDFGGSNHYWVWQIRHYLNQTGDKDFAREIIPYVDTVIGQTLREYDPNGDLLAMWGLQIGNQEDFIGNPYNGSVPSMELYNMFMTRAELSRFTGDVKGTSGWMNKASIVKTRLYKELWMNDLGRFAFYKDPTGTIMPDGQYETYLYPLIYDIVDAYDQYSGLRHLRDRLTGEDGAVFLSNNFAWHATGHVSTWGMQSGLAQQPWAAAGFSKAGLNNEAWKPLKAMADWAQDSNHRGSWPETGPEPTPAYFTPPAGLYIVSVAEDLFGIQGHAPEGYVTISPSFPDHWPYASLNLPVYKVRYSRNGNVMDYSIESAKNLPLQVRWRLPVSKIRSCTVNNRTVPYTIVPGVNHIVLCIDIPAGSKTALHIDFEPVPYKINVPHSLAEGEKFDLAVEAVTITKITDRYGVLENLTVKSASSLSSGVRRSLLGPYLGFNQLGLLNFSRRTFFIDCIADGGIPFIAAVDLNILPRFEAHAIHVPDQGDGLDKLQIMIRNNTDKNLAGSAGITISNKDYHVLVNLPPRSDQKMDIPLTSDIDLTSGDNLARVSLPDEAPLIVYFTTKGSAHQLNFKPIMLPASDLIADTLWNTLRVMPGFPHIFFTFTNYGSPRPMEALKNTKEIRVPEIPDLKFTLAGRHFLPVSHLAGKVSCKIPLAKGKFKKIYLLVLPFVDNHTMFSRVARITAYSNRQIVYARTLNYPGDVDYWVPDKNPTSFASYREPRPDRFELLPLLQGEMTDWKEGMPPAFPQSKWWSTSLPVVTESCLMNVIEMNLEKPGELDYLVFEVLGVMPAFGIVAATAEMEE